MNGQWLQCELISVSVFDFSVFSLALFAAAFINIAIHFGNRRKRSKHRRRMFMIDVACLVLIELSPLNPALKELVQQEFLRKFVSPL